MFKLGDFVRFVDEKREGYITRMIDSQTVGVTDTDGFEIPVAISNLTHVHGHISSTSGKVAISDAPDAPADFKENGVFVALEQDSKARAVVHFTLVNTTSYQLLLTLTTDRKGVYKGEFASIVAPNSSSQLYSANLGDLELWPEFLFQGLFFSAGGFKPKPPMVYAKKFKTKDFNAEKKSVPILNKSAWVIQLDEPPPVIDPEKLKQSFFKGAIQQPSVSKPPAEVDLHIEKLREDHQFLGQNQIIEIQLQYFKKTFEAAIVHQMPSIVFIHGVGNGTLRHHIHKFVSKHPQVKTFMDARKEKFGFGATEVLFKG